MSPLCCAKLWLPPCEVPLAFSPPPPLPNMHPPILHHVWELLPCMHVTHTQHTTMHAKAAQTQNINHYKLLYIKRFEV